MLLENPLKPPVIVPRNDRDGLELDSGATAIVASSIYNLNDKELKYVQ